MKNFSGGDTLRGTRDRLLNGCYAVYCILIAVLFLCAGRSACAQSRESANAGSRFLWVGGGATANYLQYGAQKNLGVTGYFDVDTIRRLGFEAEGRWLEFNQAHDIHAETYLAGPRYHLNVNRFQPYVKALSGLGNFNFSYNYAHGRYFVVAPGGGFDYRVSPRFTARADFEYQYWPQFTFGPMSSMGVSVGFRYLIVR